MFFSMFTPIVVILVTVALQNHEIAASDCPHVIASDGFCPEGPLENADCNARCSKLGYSSGQCLEMETTSGSPAWKCACCHATQLRQKRQIDDCCVQRILKRQTWLCDCNTIARIKGDPLVTTGDGNYYYVNAPRKARMVYARSLPDQDETGELESFRIVVDTMQMSKKPSHPVLTSVGNVTLEMYGQEFMLVHFIQGGTGYPTEVRQYYHNGHPIHAVPFLWTNPDNPAQFVRVFTQAQWDWVESSNGIRFKFHYHELEVLIPNTIDHIGNVDGLLGHWNMDGNPDNDIVYPNGTLYSGTRHPARDSEIINLWKADSPQAQMVYRGSTSLVRKQRQANGKKKSGKNRMADGETEEIPCKPKNRAAINQYCSAFIDKQGPFGDCLSATKHLADKAGRWYELCKLEVCATELNGAGRHTLEQIAFCDMYEQLEHECERAGHEVDVWRSKNLCGTECDDDNAEWIECVSDETDTCPGQEQSLGNGFKHKLDCVAGCQCKHGYLYDVNAKKCVTRADCP